MERKATFNGLHSFYMYPEHGVRCLTLPHYMSIRYFALCICLCIQFTQNLTSCLRVTFNQSINLYKLVHHRQRTAKNTQMKTNWKELFFPDCISCNGLSNKSICSNSHCVLANDWHKRKRIKKSIFLFASNQQQEITVFWALYAFC